MDLKSDYDLIMDTIKAYIRELSTTKRGKPSYRKYSKNKSKIFNAVSLALDIDAEVNKDKIDQAVTDYINQFADIKEINLGDACEFDVRTTIHSENKERLKCPHIEYKTKD